MSLKQDEIEPFIEQHERDSRAVKKEILKLVWFMRGAISYDDGMLLSDQDRDLVSKLIDENIKTTQKSGLPFF